MLPTVSLLELLLWNRSLQKSSLIVKLYYYLLLAFLTFCICMTIIKSSTMNIQYVNVQQFKT